MYSTIVVGADDSDTAAEAVRHAAELARRFDAHLHIVTAYKPTPVDTRGLPEEVGNAMREGSKVDTLLADLGSRLRPSGVNLTTHACKGDPADAIVDLALEQGADLIVVGNKGMKGARRILGSVPNSIAHRAPCAVLIAYTG